MKQIDTRVMLMLRQIIDEKSIIIIFSWIAVLFGCSNSQNNVTFQYKGHPVHPLLIKGLLPNPETNTSIECVNLDSIPNYDNIETVQDSAIKNSGTWVLSHFSNTGFIDYHFVSMYKNYYCLIVRDVDGSFAQAYVCFISIQNKKICLKGYLEVQNLRDNLISVSGDNLLVGSAKHSINTIIHSNMNN